jgi:hypothetical protein
MGNVALDPATQSEVFGKFPVISAIVGVVGFCDAVMSHKLQRNIKAFLKPAAAHHQRRWITSINVLWVTRDSEMRFPTRLSR